MARTVDIYRASWGGTRTYMSATFQDDGGVEIAGQDIGTAPMEHFGDSDYEYWTAVSAEHAGDITADLLRGLARRPPGGMSPIRDWLDERGIPYTTHSF